MLNERWAELALGVLQRSGALDGDATRADAEGALRTWLPDGISVRALYLDRGAAPDPGLPGQAPFVRGATAAGPLAGGWEVRQLHDDPNLANTRAALIDDLEHGVRSVWLRLGTGQIDTGALEEVLEGVLLDAAPVVLEAGEAEDEVARHFLALAAARGIAPQDLLGTLGLDPLGVEAREGSPQDLAAAIALAAQIAVRYPLMRPLVVEGLPYAEAGATDTDELGCVMATGIAYLRALADRGVSPAQGASLLEFRLAAGADQFLTIAKFRAARRLWARVTEITAEADGGARPARLHAVSSPAMLTQRDPWVNLLRVTIAVFAAGVGGADAITALPFDHALGYSDPLARRIARNTCTLLQEEAELGRVLDPAGGSWYVEQLSDQVARTAWAWMQEIERAGGQREALRGGLVAERLDRACAARDERVRHLRQPITGVSTFPELAEHAVTRPRRAVAAGKGLPARRYAEPFEALRDRAEALEKATGERPAVFFVTLGPLARHHRRAQFARNLLAAGGIASDRVVETARSGQVMRSYRRHRERVAVICGDDTDYAEQAARLAPALKAEGARLVALVGAPAGREAEWRDVGVDRFLVPDRDAIADLEALLGALEAVEAPELGVPE